MTLEKPEPADKRYKFFGALRLVLALLVVASHSSSLGGVAWDALLKPWELGNVAVMVFFVLSGYIIAEALSEFYTGRVGDFLVNRALRILPPYFAALLLSVAIHLWLSGRGAMVFFDYTAIPDGIFSLKNYAANALSIVALYGLGHVNLTPDYPFVRYFWAVRTEIHFYLVYGFLLWIAYKCGARHRAVLPVAFVAIAALAVLATVTGWSFLNYFCFASYFMVGVALYSWTQAKTRIAATALTLSSALAIWQFAQYIGKAGDVWVMGPLALLIALAALIVPLSKTRTSSALSAFDARLGDLSYPIYLNHYVVIIAALNMTAQRNMWVFALSMIACVAFSFLASLLTEPFTAKIRDRIRGVKLR